MGIFIPPSALLNQANTWMSDQSVASGIFWRFHNQSDQTTNYERVSFGFVSNKFYITPLKGGSGTVRPVFISTIQGQTYGISFDNSFGFTFFDNGNAKGGIYWSQSSGNDVSINPGSGGNISLGGTRAYLGGGFATNPSIDNMSLSGGWELGFPNAANANGQRLSIGNLTELTTIAAAASTDTTIQIPANVIVLAVTVRVTVALPVTTNFTVGDAGSAARYSTAAVSKAVNSTDPGTKAGAYYNASATAIRITPDSTPSDTTGRVRVTIHFIRATPPTS